MKNSAVNGEKFRVSKCQSVKVSGCRGVRVFRIALVILCCLGLIQVKVMAAQEMDRLTELTKMILDAKAGQDVAVSLEELKTAYFAANSYAEYIDFLKSLILKKKTFAPLAEYHIALARYRQLGYLEEAQKWDEYFASGNNYRQELVTYAQKAIAATTVSDATNISAKLLLWKYYRGMQDTAVKEALNDLLAAVRAYAREGKDPVVLRETADELLPANLKAEAKELYRLYVERLAASAITDDQLWAVAEDFYQAKNLDLSEEIFGVYLSRLEKAQAKEDYLNRLGALAEKFAYSDKTPYDAVYAEELYARLEREAGNKAFTEEHMYLRAYNLEKAQEFASAAQHYLLFVERHPGSARTQEAIYKIGIIYAYCLRQEKEAGEYFGKLSGQESVSPYTISALYQLGLLAQYRQDYEQAEQYYTLLLLKAQDGYSDSVNRAKIRIKEIDESRSLEYNLRVFLDAALAPENANLTMANVGLRAQPYRPNMNDAVNIEATSFGTESGCMPAELQYLWSGNLGSTTPTQAAASFDTTYKNNGTKEINLVVTSAVGIVDYRIDMVDVQ